MSLTQAGPTLSSRSRYSNGEATFWILESGVFMGGLQPWVGGTT